MCFTFVPGRASFVVFLRWMFCGDENTLHQSSLSSAGDGGNPRVELNVEIP